jgi:hypothetical protein
VNYPASLPTPVSLNSSLVVVPSIPVGSVPRPARWGQTLAPSSGSGGRDRRSPRRGQILAPSRGPPGAGPPPDDPLDGARFWPLREDRRASSRRDRLLHSNSKAAQTEAPVACTVAMRTTVTLVLIIFILFSKVVDIPCFGSVPGPATPCLGHGISAAPHQGVGFWGPTFCCKRTAALPNHRLYCPS